MKSFFFKELKLISCYNYRCEARGQVVNMDTVYNILTFYVIFMFISTYSKFNFIWLVAFHYHRSHLARFTQAKILFKVWKSLLHPKFFYGEKKLAINLSWYK